MGVGRGYPNPVGFGAGVLFSPLLGIGIGTGIPELHWVWGQGYLSVQVFLNFVVCDHIL